MKSIQYTIRGIPEQLDRRARQAARKEHLSLNTLLLKALAKGLGEGETPSEYRDLDELAGTWVADPATDQALAAFEEIDAEAWK